MKTTVKFSFDAAHYLPENPDYIGPNAMGDGHKCRKVHGHRYEIEADFRADYDPECGMSVAFATLSQPAENVRMLLDHKCLNDIEGLENPTSENLAIWIWEMLHVDHSAIPSLRLVAIRVSETGKYTVEYCGEDI